MCIRDRHHPAGEEQPGLDQAHEQQQADQRPEGGQVVLGERAVHDPAEDHRDGEGAQHAERGGRHRDGQRPRTARAYGHRRSRERTVEWGRTVAVSSF